MITNRDFIVLSDDLDGIPSSPKHLFRHIALHNRVFWFNVINRLPQLTWNDMRRVATIIGRWIPFKGRSIASANDRRRKRGTIACCYDGTPFFIPWFNSPVRKLNCVNLLWNFRHISRRYRIREPIVLTQWPSTADFIKAVPAALKVYYCVDDWPHYPGFNSTNFAAMEAKLIGCVDAFVSTSRDLHKKGTNCPASLYLPHGVDFEHFAREAQPSQPVRKLTKLPRPIVGFFGCIDKWVDLDLIVTLSRKFPQFSFVVFGKRNVPIDSLSNCSNVHYFGMLPYPDLPRYAAHFDIGLIPFVRNTLTEAVNPLKLLEYFALGLPVLATRLPELEAYSGPIRLAADSQEFCEQLKNMVDSGLAKDQTARQIASRNTWKQRAEKLCSFLQTLP